MKHAIKRQFEKGTETAIDGWDIPGAPEWANGALEVKRINSKQMDDGKVKDEIWISSQNEDRDGDIIIATGIKLDDYFKNPVVGWNHGLGSLDIPIGKTTSIDTVEGKGLAAEWIWPPWKHIDAEMGVERVDDIHRLWAGHFINAASIWFIILSAEIREGHENDWWPPLIVHECSLMEWALVYVPANQDAVRRSMKAIHQHDYLKRLKRKFRKKEQSDAENKSLKGEIRNVTLPLTGFDNLKQGINQLSESTNNLKGILK